MMGYDWIAHMVENESVVHNASDNFFEKIEDFRKENWEHCRTTQPTQPSADKNKNT